jgi:hypothetical protein
MSVLEIRGDGPRRRIIRVDQIQDGFIILEERGRGCLKKGVVVVTLAVCAKLPPATTETVLALSIVYAADPVSHVDGAAPTAGGRDYRPGISLEGAAVSVCADAASAPGSDPLSIFSLVERSRDPHVLEARLATPRGDQLPRKPLPGALHNRTTAPRGRIGDHGFSSKPIRRIPNFARLISLEMIPQKLVFTFESLRSRRRLTFETTETVSR